VGLDVFDLIFEVEDEFDIKIEDLVANDCSTVGEIYQCVKKKTNSITMPVKDIPFECDEIWERVITVISEQLKVNKGELKPETDFFRDLGFK
jgi:acyl carrier protein